MKKISAVILLLTLFFSVSCGQQGPNVIFVEDSNNKKIDVMVDNKLLTTYQSPDNICKPVLYPLCTSSGTETARKTRVIPHTGMKGVTGSLPPILLDGLILLTKRNSSILRYPQVNQLSSGTGLYYLHGITFQKSRLTGMPTTLQVNINN
jgi:hypothetical protein